MGKLMEALCRFRDETLLHRTGYTAKDLTGKIVKGCVECHHNVTVHNPICDAHQCEVSIDEFGRKLTILDPYNVPELCAMRIPMEQPGDVKKE